MERSYSSPGTLLSSQTLLSHSPFLTHLLKPLLPYTFCKLALFLEGLVGEEFVFCVGGGTQGLA